MMGFLTAGHEGCALIAAASGGHRDIIEMVLEWGVITPPNLNEALYRAACQAAYDEGHSHIVRFLKRIKR